MQLNNIADGLITVTLDYEDCYALGEALEYIGGHLAGPDVGRFQLYEAMAAAFLAAGMAGDMHAKMDDPDRCTLELLREEYRPAIPPVETEGEAHNGV